MEVFNKSSLLSIAKGTLHSTVGAALFLAIVQPFGLDEMNEGRLVYILMMSVLVFAAGMISRVLSAAISGRFLKGVQKYLPLLISFIISIPILTLFLGLLSCHYFSYPVNLGVFLSFFKWVSALSLFLFIWECLRLKNAFLEKELDDVKALNALLENRQESNEERPRKCILKGQTNIPALEVEINSIVYIESIANYADVCYFEGENLRHKTLRITLKAVRESLGEDNSMIQCHRAFIVNLNFVVSVEKSPGGCQLQMFGMDKRIPISRSNATAIKEKLLAGTKQ